MYRVNRRGKEWETIVKGHAIVAWVMQHGVADRIVAVLNGGAGGVPGYRDWEYEASTHGHRGCLYAVADRHGDAELVLVAGDDHEEEVAALADRLS